MTAQPDSGSAHVVHRLPGRTRLRVPRSHRSPAAMDRIRTTLEQVPGVGRVEVNRAAGSVVVHHDPQTTRLDDLDAALEEGLGFVLSLVPPRERERVRAEASTLAHEVRRQFSRFDASIARATDGWIDLKMLVPVAFVGAAALQVTLSEGGWTAVPPYVLLYYAFDTYMKFHILAPAGQAARAALEAAPPDASTAAAEASPA